MVKKKIAFVYAGQGSQKTGMGEDFFHQSPPFKEWIDSANQSLLNSYQSLVFNAHMPLDETRYAQIALFLFNEGVRRHLAAHGLEATHTAGLSLGEYNALVDASVLDSYEALELVQIRALAMHQTALEQPTSMMALRLDKPTVLSLLDGNLSAYLANHNAPLQCVVGGDEAGLAHLSEKLKAEGLKRGIPLKTSGAFHTPYMRTAQGPLKQALYPVDFNTPKKKLYQNVCGCEASKVSASSLVDHLTHPVLWADIMQNMVDEGIEIIVEIGPGNVLSKLFQTAHPDLDTYQVSTIEEAQKVITILKGGK